MATCVGNPTTETDPNPHPDRSHEENYFYHYMKLNEPVQRIFFLAYPHATTKKDPTQPNMQNRPEEIEEEEKKDDVRMKLKKETSMDIGQEPILPNR